MGHDPALVNKIMARRNLEMKYRAQIRENSRTRGRGADHSALDEQIQDKLAAKAKEREADLSYDRMRIAADQVLQVCTSIRAEAVREREKATMQYSLDNHRKETRREYSLSDPTSLRRERPIREGDNDPHLGPSSIQVFEGEKGEKSKGENKKAVQRAQRDWLAAQVAEKKAIQEELKRQDLVLDEEAARANEIRGLVEVANAQEQVEDKKIEAQENLRIAQEHKERRKQQRDKEAAATQAHVFGQLQDERMTEVVDYALGVDGRLMKGEYKRLSIEEEANVYATNARLIKAKHERARAEKAEELVMKQQQMDADAVLNAIEESKAQGAIARRKKIEEDNKGIRTKRNEIRDAIKRSELIGISGVPATNTETKPFMVKSSSYTMC